MSNIVSITTQSDVSNHNWQITSKSLHESYEYKSIQGSWTYWSIIGCIVGICISQIFDSLDNKYCVMGEWTFWRDLVGTRGR